MASMNPFGAESKLTTKSGDYTIFRLGKLAEAKIGDINTLPFSIRVLLEALLRNVDEFVVTWFNIGTEQTLPVVIWGLLRRGIDPSINALATVVLASLVFLVVLSNRLNRRSV